MSTKFDVTKGNRDWYGLDAVLRNKISTDLRTVFERYGFEPIDTPIIESQEAITFKGGGEIKKEVFKLSDQGNRDLALRFDQTVPLARFVATHEDIKFPFKRYTIGPVFRDGPTQPEQGRYRQFTQCDVDTLGVPQMAAEAELFALAYDAFEMLGLGGVDVNINNRKLLEGILECAQVPVFARLRTISVLDKMDKIGEEGIRESLNKLTLYDKTRGVSNETLLKAKALFEEKGVTAVSSLRNEIISEVGENGYSEISTFLITAQNPDEAISKLDSYQTQGEILLTERMVADLMRLVQRQEDNKSTYKKLESEIGTNATGNQGLKEIKQLLEYSESMGFDFVHFDPSLARGLDYYTGTTIEVFLNDRDILNSAILGGGRFDNMVGDFRGRGEEIPAVGFSFGLERLVMILKKQNPEARKTSTQLYLIPIRDTLGDCLKAAHNLRKEGVNLDIYFQRGKVGKAIEYAVAKGIPYVGIIGEDELSSKTIKIKNLANGTQNNVSLSDVAKYLTGIPAN